MAVIDDASITATRLPCSASNSSTAPWCESSPVPWLSGKTVITFAPTAFGAPKYAGMTANALLPSGRRST
jgi:hypothetical protein